MSELIGKLETERKAKEEAEADNKVLERKAQEDVAEFIAKLEAGRKARDEQKAREVAEHSQ